MSDSTKAIIVVAIWGGSGLIATGSHMVSNIVLGVVALMATMFALGAFQGIVSLLPLDLEKTQKPDDPIK